VIIIHTTDPAYLEQVFLVCVLSSYLVYISVFISYLLFQHRYSTMQREFRNPLGRFAPIYGIAFCLVGMASVVAFQDGTEMSLIIFVGYLIFLVAFYYCYGYKTQILSEDEQKVMFKAYVMNGK
jgi:L-asparagine transporter-like permease